MDDSGIFPFLAAKAEARVRAALVTVTAVSGSSTRNPGAHMGVAEDGAWRGSLSGGCIEAAVVAEARDAITAGRPRAVRFGAGSPFLDIRLPCGGWIELLINPVTDAAPIRAMRDRLAAREPVILTLPRAPGSIAAEPGEAAWRTSLDEACFRVAHQPALALFVIGHGAAVEALRRQARALGADVRVMTPDRRVATRLRARKAAVTLLRLPGDAPPLAADRWTAIVFLFHDHDWETVLMPEALASAAFYVGAMGSHATQARRAESLAAAGVAPEAIARLRAPIGLIPSSRDPQTLALSALAEIVRDYDRLTARPDLTSACRA